MLTTYHHISRFKPSEVSGGVERFAEYLGRAVPDLEYLSFEDYPLKNDLIAEGLPDYDLALNLNAWLVSTGVLNKDSVVIVDGYWGLGLEEKVGRLISVCHGSYWGRFMQFQVSSWGEIVGSAQIDRQIQMWESPGVEIVAVSPESRREIIESCPDLQYDPVVIVNGVDTEILCPVPEIQAKPQVLMHAAVSNRKGADIINNLIYAQNIGIELMGKCDTLEQKRDRLNEAIALIAPTRHEGNAYVLLEAMASGVPVITYLAGLAHEFDDRCGIVTDDMAPQNFARLIRKFRRENHDPREWVLENASLECFIEDWRHFLDV